MRLINHNTLIESLMYGRLVLLLESTLRINVNISFAGTLEGKAFNFH